MNISVNFKLKNIKGKEKLFKFKVEKLILFIKYI